MPDADDHFILTLNDAQTARNLLMSGGAVITGGPLIILLLWEVNISPR